jgi:enoyl-CoA hydratase
MSQTENSLLRSNISNRIAILTLCDPPKRNAMSLPLRRELISTLKGLEASGAVDAVIITGDGEKSFSAGADINEVALRTPSGELSVEAQLRRELPRLIETTRLPTIAAINGYCLGAGLELALACTLRIGSSNAIFGLPEINLGVIPGSGGTQRLARFVGLGNAMEMVTTGEPISADEAFRIGLISKVVPQVDLMTCALDYCKKWQSKGAFTLMLARDAVLKSVDVDLLSGLDYENKLFALALSSPERDEGIAAFKEKRPANFRKQ